MTTPKFPHFPNCVSFQIIFKISQKFRKNPLKVDIPFVFLLPRIASGCCGDVFSILALPCPRLFLISCSMGHVMSYVMSHSMSHYMLCQNIFHVMLYMLSSHITSQITVYVPSNVMSPVTLYVMTQ